MHGTTSMQRRDFTVDRSVLVPASTVTGPDSPLQQFLRPHVEVVNNSGLYGYGSVSGQHMRYGQLQH
jgi:hypothetical protein